MIPFLLHISIPTQNFRPVHAAAGLISWNNNGPD